MAEMLLEFYVKDQTLVRKKDGQIPRKDSEGYLFLKFNFIGQTWENLDIIPWIGYQDENKQAWSVKSDTIVDLNRYQVPAGYLGQDYFLVSLSGTNSDGTQISTNIVKVPLAEASSEIVDLPSLPEDANGQSIIDLVSKAVDAAQASEQYAKAASEDADEAYVLIEQAQKDVAAAKEAAKEVAFVDVTEEYKASEYTEPFAYLLTLGVGKWQIDDAWAIYQSESLDIEGTIWTEQRVRTDDQQYTHQIFADDLEVYKLNFENTHGEIKIGGLPLELGNGNIYIQEEEPVDAPDGSLWIDQSAQGIEASCVTYKQMQEYVAAQLAAIPVGEEMLFG